MHKILTIVIAVVFPVLLASCVMVTVKDVKPGKDLTVDNGYIAIVFTNKIEPVAFGKRNVYVVLQQGESGKRFYLPFGAGGSIRLIAVSPGNYRIEDFVYMTGIEGTKKDDSQKQNGVLYSAPQRSGTSLTSADYPDGYCKDFKVEVGEIVYIGDYSWKSEFSILGKHPIMINRSVQSDDTVFSAIRKTYPDMPASIAFLSLSILEKTQRIMK